MTVATEKESMEDSAAEISSVSAKKYGCEILLEKTTLEKTNDKSFPTDALLIWYEIDGVEHLDLTRRKKRVDLFDMYYDMHGKNVIKRIDYGFGRISPKMWGYKAPDKKKRK